MNPIEKGINALNETVGFWASFLILPLIGVVAWEVLMRYGFSSPTVWAFEMTAFLYGTHYMLGLGYAYKYDTHVCIDVFTTMMAEKKRATLRLIMHVIFFLPVMGAFAMGAIIYASDSVANLERNSTSWAPSIWPYKIVMAVGFVILTLQGISKVCEDIRTLKS